MILSQCRQASLKLAALFCVAVFLFPPWQIAGGGGAARWEGFAFILSPPIHYASIAVPLLLAEWLLIAIVSFIFYKLDTCAPIPRVLLRWLGKPPSVRTDEIQAITTLVNKIETNPMMRTAVGEALNDDRKKTL